MRVDILRRDDQDSGQEWRWKNQLFRIQGKSQEIMIAESAFQTAESDIIKTAESRKLWQQCRKSRQQSQGNSEGRDGYQDSRVGHQDRTQRKSIQQTKEIMTAVSDIKTAESDI